jgi:hypothetical protein
MTSRDHSKALGIIYGLLGLPFILLILASPLIIPRNIDSYPSQRRPGQILMAAGIFCFVLLIALLLLFTAYGLIKGKSQARTIALIIAVLLVWWFPLGTALAIYSWWFLHSEGGKRFYLKN